MAAPLVAPPRTIEDVTATLDQEKLADPKRAAAARSRADATPPAAAAPAVLYRFYFERGLAAREIGRASQETADLARALEIGGTDPPRLVVLIHLAGTEGLSGSFARALSHLDEAERLAGSQYGWLILIHQLRALYAAGSGDVDGCAAEVDTIVDLAQRSRSYPDARWQRWARLVVADARARLSQLRGDYRESERFYRQALAEIEGGGPYFTTGEIGVVVDYAYSSFASLLVEQGRFLEAEGVARSGLRVALSHGGRYSSRTALALLSLTWTVLAQGRNSEAETLARATVQIYETVGTSPDSARLAKARGMLALSLVAQRRWSEGIAEYGRMRKGLDTEESTYARYYSGSLGWALALLNEGQPHQALEILRDAESRTTRLFAADHPQMARVRALMATAHAAGGSGAQALPELRATIPRLLSAASRWEAVDGGEERGDDMVLGLALASYIAVLADARGTVAESQLGIDAVAETFHMAEAARGRSVQRALDASAARASAATPPLAALVRDEQDTRLRIGALTGMLANTLAQSDPKNVAVLQAQIDALRRWRAELARRIEREFPVYARLVNPEATTIEAARASLKPRETLLATFVGENRTFVWAVPHTGPVLFAAVRVGRAAIDEMVAKLRAALDPAVRVLGDIPEFDVALAHRLYQLLLEPVAEGWRDAETLLVVPHGALGQLPFSLLVTRPAALGPARDALFSNYRTVPWLGRTHAIAVLPSAGALVTLRRLPLGDTTRLPFVGFGDPYFSPQQARRAAAQREAPVDVARAPGEGVEFRNLNVTAANSRRLAMLPRLPDTAEEILSIARTMNADPVRDVFLGERANEHIVKTVDLTRYRVIAFATHGLSPGDLDGLAQPALALSAPDVAHVDGDGLLTLEKILALRLNADWVVLSACNTAAGNGAGSETISGLGRAFFYAGARALLVSNWPVETTSARVLTTELFRRQAAAPGQSRAQALRATLNGVIDGPGYVDPQTNRVLFSYAHPIFWAPFTLVGDGG